MNWFKEHVYLASWASPIIALLINILKGKGRVEAININDFVIYTIIFICLGVVIAPGDQPGRGYCGFILGSGFMFLMYFRR